MTRRRWPARWCSFAGVPGRAGVHGVVDGRTGSRRDVVDGAGLVEGRIGTRPTASVTGAGPAVPAPRTRGSRLGPGGLRRGDRRVGRRDLRGRSRGQVGLRHGWIGRRGRRGRAWAAGSGAEGAGAATGGAWPRAGRAEGRVRRAVGSARAVRAWVRRLWGRAGGRARARRPVGSARTVGLGRGRCGSRRRRGWLGRGVRRCGLGAGGSARRRWCGGCGAGAAGSGGRRGAGGSGRGGPVRPRRLRSRRLRRGCRLRRAAAPRPAPLDGVSRSGRGIPAALPAASPAAAT